MLSSIDLEKDAPTKPNMPSGGCQFSSEHNLPRAAHFSFLRRSSGDALPRRILFGSCAFTKRISGGEWESPRRETGRAFSFGKKKERAKLLAKRRILAPGQPSPSREQKPPKAGGPGVPSPALGPFLLLLIVLLEFSFVSWSKRFDEPIVLN